MTPTTTLTACVPPEATLDDLATAINDEHRQAEAAMNTGLQHALEAGRLLLEAKALCAHGQWLPWVADNFEGSIRTSQCYTRLAERWPQTTNTSRSI